MSRKFRNLALTAAILAAAAAGSPLAASTAAAASPCGVASGGQYHYSVTSTATSGHNKKAVTTPTAGEFGLTFSLSSPSCPGSTYAITIASPDGTSLGWSTVRATSYLGTDTSTQDVLAPPAATVASVSGSSVTVTFTGDGLAQTFDLLGTTSGYAGYCVNTSGVISNPDGTTQAASPRDGACDSGGSGGGYYWG